MGLQSITCTNGIKIKGILKLNVTCGTHPGGKWNQSSDVIATCGA